MEICQLVQKLDLGKDLSPEEATYAFDSMLEAKLSDAEISLFLIALAKKGEVGTEIQAVIDSIQRHSTRITPNTSRPLVDTCGTGGDSSRTFNISTAAAIVASSAGAAIAKHGNKSASGICGSADFMEQVGINLNAHPTIIKESIEKLGVAFLYAPMFHPLMRNVASARKKAGTRTIFNIAGPLCNPCEKISGQVIGVYSKAIMNQISEVAARNVPNTMVVTSDDGLDELSNTCDNEIIWIRAGQKKRSRLDPSQFGLELANENDLIISSKEESIGLTMRVIYGRARKSQEDIVVLNSAAALLVSDVCGNFREGITRSRDAIRSGAAQEQLSKLVALCGDTERLRIAETRYLGI